MLYQHLASDIKFDWNFDDIIHLLKDDVYYGDNIPAGMWDKIDGSYFQTFYSKVSTSTNFYKYFPKYAEDIIDKIAHLQNKVQKEVDSGFIEKTFLIEKFLERKLFPEDVLFLRIDPSQGADPHIDKRRQIALNIGFQNSCTCTTYWREGFELENFYDDFTKLKAITMNDGDAYLVDVGQAHAVQANFPEIKGLQRYVISHNLARY